MAVRNFWLDGQVDGCETPIACGPQNADGGFDLTINVRDCGESRPALRIRGLVNPGDPDELVLTVYADNGGELIEGTGWLTIVSPRNGLVALVSPP